MSLSPRRWFSLAMGLCVGACGLGEEIRLGGAPPASAGGSNVGGSSSGGDDPVDPVGGMGGLSASSGGSAAASGGMGGQPGPVVSVQVNAIVALAELNSEDKDDNPTLSQDELVICFTSKRPTSTGGTDIWCAERASRGDPFGEPIEQTSLNTEGFESSPALSSDGLTLWFSSDVEDDLDIYVATRTAGELAWGEPAPVDELNSSEDDIPRPPGVDSRVMPLASRRDSPDYWTYLATRPSVDEPFDEPTLIEELAVEGRSFVDAQLSGDGLHLFFTLSQEDGKGDLYVASRPSLTEPFAEPEALGGLNTSSDERDPFLSADGTRFYFSSDRDGELDLFVADVMISSR